MKGFFKKFEFSKIIIIWALIISTVCILAYSIGYYIFGSTPTELVTLIGTILTGTVLAYMSKALVENVNKIKTNSSNSKNTEKEKEKVSKTSIGVINTYIPEVDGTSTTE